ncbi:vitelline membrane outer layer protein 1-like, partial [Clarias magur]
VEGMVGNGDNTALNGIALRCTVLQGGNELYSTVKSEEGSWGTWSQNIWCKNGVLSAFQLRVENYQENDDDTAANNI